MRETSTGTSRPDVVPLAMTLGEVIDVYMACYAARDGVILARLRWWKRRLGDRAIPSVTEDDLDAAVAVLQSEEATYYAGKTKDGRSIFRSRGKRSGATINRYIAALGSIFAFARRKRLTPRGWQNPLKAIERDQESPGRARYLSEDEYRRLLAAAKVSRWPRLYVLIRLAVESGCRKGSLLGLRWSDMDLDVGRALVERTKNGDGHVIVLLPETVAELRRFEGKLDELVFPGKRDPKKPYSVGTAFDFALKSAQIQGVTFHCMRHTHASWLVRRGASLIQIADSMGHKSMSMVKRYSHLAADDRAKLLERVFGDDK
jgi:integrase